MKTRKSALLLKVPGIEHEFGTAAFPIPDFFRQSRNQPKWEQIRETQLGVFRPDSLDLGPVDALVSETTGYPVAVRTADCVPILLAHHQGTVVMAVHAGWNGTLKRIFCEVDRWMNKNRYPWSDFYAAVGPAIGPCCYEVSLDLIDRFQKTFSGLLPAAEFTLPGNKLDLQAILAAELRAYGIREVEILRECTFCSREKEQFCYFSHRRNKDAGRQYAAIGKLK